MHRSPMSYRSTALLLGALLLAAAPASQAAVTFASVGGNLVVTIDQPIVFTMTAGATVQSIIVNFEDVYATDGTAVKTTTPTPAYATSGAIHASAGSTQAINYGATGQRTTTAGIRDANDFYITFLFGTAPPSSAGTTFTIQPGTITLSGANQAPLPDFAVSTAQLTDASSNTLSNPVSVPESSAALLGAVGLAGLLLRRRRGM